jgi:hypothetical protein
MVMLWDDALLARKLIQMGTPTKIAQQSADDTAAMAWSGVPVVATREDRS